MALVSVVNSMKYDPQAYQEEKELGIRRPNGVHALKKLSPVHNTIIQLHLIGLSNKEIALRVRRSPAVISTVLRDPLVVEQLQEAFKDEQVRLQSLTGKAVDVVKTAMEKEDIGTQLRGVDRYIKLRESIGEKKAGEETAEDVVERILAGVQVNVQVNNG